MHSRTEDGILTFWPSKGCSPFLILPPHLWVLSSNLNLSMPFITSLDRILALLVESFDRYRKALKGTWKDQSLPAAGATYDLGSHLIDQTLVLFGRPSRITAFIQNSRGVGDPNVDDSVCALFLLFCISMTPAE